jgi:hypothetical protein
MKHKITLECGGTTDDAIIASVEPQDEVGHEKLRQFWNAEVWEVLPLRKEIPNMVVVFEV